MQYKKLIKLSLLFMCVLALFMTGCNKPVLESNDIVEESVTGDENAEAIEVNNDEKVSDSEQETLAYKLETRNYTSEDDKIIIDYLIMTGFSGELTQDYINQSFYKIIDLYKESDFYEQVRVTPEIWWTTDTTISMVYRGSATLNGGKTVEIFYPVNIDVKTSNEINYENLINDNQAVRDILGIVEAEGIRVYMNEEKIFFAYMPLDDSATELMKVSADRSQLLPYLNTEFGDHPAS